MAECDDDDDDDDDASGMRKAKWNSVDILLAPVAGSTTLALTFTHTLLSLGSLRTTYESNITIEPMSTGLN